MGYFYDALKSGVDKSEAVQIARQTIREKHSADPRDWAAFVLSGDDSPVY